MQQFTRDEYLEQEVRTASPQKLQLMLIEAAIRQVQRAKQLWSQTEYESAGEAIIRAQQIVSYLLAAATSTSRSLLACQVAAVYTFIVRSLTKAHLQRDEQALLDVLRVLEIERETWRQACQHLGHNPPPSAPLAPHFVPSKNSATHEQSSGFSWHA